MFDALLGCDAWLMSQDEEVMGMIESYNSCVVEAPEPLIDALRTGLVSAVEEDTTSRR